MKEICSVIDSFFLFCDAATDVTILSLTFIHFPMNCSQLSTILLTCLLINSITPKDCRDSSRICFIVLLSRWIRMLRRGVGNFGPLSIIFIICVVGNHKTVAHNRPTWNCAPLEIHTWMHRLIAVAIKTNDQRMTSELCPLQRCQSFPSFPC